MEAVGDGGIGQFRKHRVCKSAIASILDFGRQQWATCQEAVDKNKLPAHRKKDAKGDRTKWFDDEVKEDLRAFFEEMKLFAQPTSTRFVREDTGAGLRDGEEGILELPTLCCGGRM